MQFIKDFVRNLVILFVMVLILLALFPTMMSQVLQFYSLIFGPLAILMVIVFALPRRRRRRY